MRKIKLLALVSMLVVATMALVGCGDVECSMCGETKSGDTYEVLGQEVDICDDCYEEMEKLGDMLK